MRSPRLRAPSTTLASTTRVELADQRLGSLAGSFRDFEPVVVPGLLQTEDYTSRDFRYGPRELDCSEAERRVEFRLAHQDTLTPR